MNYIQYTSKLNIPRNVISYNVTEPAVPVSARAVLMCTILLCMVVYPRVVYFSSSSTAGLLEHDNLQSAAEVPRIKP